MLASIIIRTYNEERYLPRVLEAIRQQELKDLSSETIVVDSGSTDSTRSIAEAQACNIVHISRDEFTFGRSLNLGCEAAQGDLLVFISGHCVPTNGHWLQRLVSPLSQGAVAFAYGRQIGGKASNFSECQVFKKYYPDTSHVPQDGFFCNNANAAILRSTWGEFRFDEDLTGLEDMYLAKKLTEAGLQIGYVADATVYHHHHETWSGVRRRYEREAIALQHIMPEVHITPLDFARYWTRAVFRDSAAAVRDGRGLKTLYDISMFRLMQFWGSYRGNHSHRKISRKRKERYFYPN